VITLSLEINCIRKEAEQPVQEESVATANGKTVCDPERVSLIMGHMSLHSRNVHGMVISVMKLSTFCHPEDQLCLEGS
jgi:hypothetical protein